MIQKGWLSVCCGIPLCARQCFRERLQIGCWGVLLPHCFHRRREQRGPIGVMSLSPENGTAQRAAIYSDGTTFGDRNVLSAMIDYRRSMLAALNGIGATLCTLGTRQSAIADVDAALGQQQAAQDKFCTGAEMVAGPQVRSPGEHGMRSTSSGPAWPTRQRTVRGNRCSPL